MKPKDKKYILQNSPKKTIKEISQELGLKEKKIRKFLDSDSEKKERVLSKKDPHLSSFKKKTVFLSIALIFILGFGVYYNSLHGAFLWDDDDLVKNNASIKSFSSAGKVFSKSSTEAGRREFGFYRPLQELTYTLDYALWKFNARGYHGTNVLLHVLAALALFWLISLFYHDVLLSLLTSLFFIVHPIHTEAVAYISGRADSLAAIFVLLCLVFYIKHLSSKSAITFILMVVSYIFALLARENSLILPVLLLLYHYSFKKSLEIKAFLSVLTVTFFYLFLRLTVLKFLLCEGAYTTTLLQRMPGFFEAVTHYLTLLLLPVNLHMEYGNKVFSWVDPKVIAGILMLSFLLFYVGRTRKSRGLVFISVSWFLLTLLPQANIYPINAYMAEHWLYLPSIGFFLIVAKALTQLCRVEKFRILAGLLIISSLVFYSCLTIRQNFCWSEPVAFYERTLRYAPESSKVQNNLANMYYHMGKKDEAIALYKKAIKNNPDYAEAVNNLGNIYKDMGKKEEAIALYRRALEIDPGYYEAYGNLGIVSYLMGKKEEAISLLKKAIELKPTFAEAYYNLSACYFYEKEYGLAIQYCDKAGELGIDNSHLAGLLEPYRK